MAGTLLAVLALAAGCASPAKLRAKRIQQEWDYFTSLPRETQDRLQFGQIEVGDSRKMAWIALGGPDREYTRVRKEGTNTVWAYTFEDIQVRRDMVPISGWSHGTGGRAVPYYDYGWVRHTERREYEVLRVEFEGEHVETIESLADW